MLWRFSGALVDAVDAVVGAVNMPVFVLLLCVANLVFCALFMFFFRPQFAKFGHLLQTLPVRIPWSLPPVFIFRHALHKFLFFFAFRFVKN